MIALKQLLKNYQMKSKIKVPRKELLYKACQNLKKMQALLHQNIKILNFRWPRLERQWQRCLRMKKNSSPQMNCLKEWIVPDSRTMLAKSKCILLLNLLYSMLRWIFSITNTISALNLQVRPMRFAKTKRWTKVLLASRLSFSKTTSLGSKL